MTANRQVPMVESEPVCPFSGQLKFLFGNIFDCYGTLDRTGSVIEIAGRIFERTSADPKLLSGEPFAQTVFWQSSENTSKVLEKSIQTAASGEYTKLLVDFRISADEKVPVELHLQPSGESPDKIYIFGQVIKSRNDVVTGKVESEQLLAAAENAEIGLWYWDFVDDTIYSTPRCNELLGLPAYEEVTSRSFLKVLHPNDRASVEDYLQSSRLAGTKYEVEFRVVYPDETVDWVSAEGKSFLDSAGRPDRMMGVLRKITDEKLAAEELAIVYDREKKARDEAVAANRAKDLFLGFVSHELRTPLNTIQGWAQILLTKEVDSVTQRNALETIERSVHAQTKLINDLVDSARVASGRLKLEYRATNLYEIVRGSYEGQRPAAEAHRLQYEFESVSKEIAVTGDAGRLQQVFNNLISNAIKFTPEGGRVVVSIETGNRAVKVHVRDTGHGISADALPHIFEQWSQGDAPRTKNMGIGLGLSIVKVLVLRHRGTVEATSEGLGKGSEFTVTLPLTESGSVDIHDSHPPEATETRPLEGLRILVVEDDHDSREVLQLFLQQHGANVAAADSPRQAYTILSNSIGRLPNVIISDIGMPDEDGYSMVSRIRQLPASEGGLVPAIALSAFNSSESRQRAFEAGFQKYSTKPFDDSSIIRDILDLARTREKIKPGSAPR
ncbi:MAG TPA: ATP-binding protein [Pyrinomonadaceae bacterium]|nr:ATP-binding protein [Pyrinomonadaceae bacterium]